MGKHSRIEESPAFVIAGKQYDLSQSRDSGFLFDLGEDGRSSELQRITEELVLTKEDSRIIAFDPTDTLIDISGLDLRVGSAADGDNFADVLFTVANLHFTRSSQRVRGGQVLLDLSWLEYARHKRIKGGGLAVIVISDLDALIDIAGFDVVRKFLEATTIAYTSGIHKFIGVRPGVQKVLRRIDGGNLLTPIAELA